MRLLVFSLLVVGSLALCSNNKNCKFCVHEPGCTWCGENEKCIPTNDTCVGCAKTDIDQCTAQTCSALTDCNSCGSSGCIWCADTGVCREPDSKGRICEKDSANCVKCVRDGKSSSTGCYPSHPSITVPMTCPAITNCRECALAGCGWCVSSGKCLDYDHADRQRPFCGSDKCDSCTRYRPDECPTKVCEQQSNCRDCSTSGCAWCSDSQKCVEYDPYLRTECLPNPTCTFCLKTAPTSCPINLCRAQTSCSTCAMAGCIWCNSTQQCFEATADLSAPCSAAQCYKGFTSDCMCSQRTGSCSDCTAWKEGEIGCGWCDQGEGANGTCIFGTATNHFGKCVPPLGKTIARWNFTKNTCWVPVPLPHWFQGVAFVGMFFLTILIGCVWTLIIFCRWYRARKYKTLG